MSPRRGIIFDLDGVLTDTAELHYQAWQRLADEEGLAFDRARNDALRGVSRADSLRLVLDGRAVDDETFAAMLARKNDYYVAGLDDLGPNDALEGAVGLVVDAKRRDWLVAIGSSSRNARTVLKRLGLIDLFDAIADGASASNAKPAPDIFLAAATMMGVAPADCVVVEDAASGVDAGLAAGMTVVGVGPADRVGHAHHRFASTAHVELDVVVAPRVAWLERGPRLVDGWSVVTDQLRPDDVVVSATNHLTGNGYLGYRGTMPEWEADATVACTVTDTWDNADGKWTELCTVPNALWARWEHGTGPIRVAHDRPLEAGASLEQRLDTRHGVFRRAFAPANGPVASLVDERFASMARRHLVAQRQELDAEPGARLTVTTGIDGRVWSLNGDHFGHVEASEDGDVLQMTVTTREHGLPIIVAHGYALRGAEVAGARVEADHRRLVRVIELVVGGDGRIVLEQFMAVHSGNDVADPHAASVGLARTAAQGGWDAELAAHVVAWERLWRRVDVRIDGDDVAQGLLRFNTYHSVIATPMHADHLPIGARGLSCQAYQGAAFWDQEVFNLPMWVHTVPEVARQLLGYRHHTLDGARRKAAGLGYRGAYYAWISGATGDELCPDFFFVDVLSGRPIRNHFNDWQMHVSPDIVVALDGYVRATGDRGLLADGGAEIVFEVARFLTSFVHWLPTDERFHFVRLLGPDEYHENVDDDVFTVEQSRVALSLACRLWDEMGESDAALRTELADRLGIDVDEHRRWEEVLARLVEVEPDPASGLIEQFRGYFALEDVDPDLLRERLQHPDEYWGWPNGVAVHTQVLKQPDVVQLFVCQPERYPREVVEANFDYYLPRTQHGSSLSRPMHALVAARLGRLDEAYALFVAGASVDLLADHHPSPGGTFIGGIHIAAAGAAWQVAVLGFGGVHIRDTHVEVSPRLPGGWEALRFGLHVRGSWLEVDARPDLVVVTGAADNPGPVAVDVDGHRQEVGSGASAVFARAPERTR